MGTSFSARAAACNRNRGLTLGRSFHFAADPTARRTRFEVTVATVVYSTPGIPPSMDAARPSFTNHAQAADFEQRTHYGRTGVSTRDLIRRNYRDRDRTNRRSAVVRRRIDSGGARTRQRKCRSRNTSYPPRFANGAARSLGSSQGGGADFIGNRSRVFV